MKVDSVQVPLIAGAVADTLTQLHISSHVSKRVAKPKREFVAIPGLAGRIERIKEAEVSCLRAQAGRYAPTARKSNVAALPVREVVLPDGSKRLQSEKLVECGRAEFWLDGSLCKVSKPMGYGGRRGSPHRRGIVLGFSAGARRRLMRKIAMLRVDVRPLFVTMTYPGEFASDPKQWKVDLDDLAQRFRRAYPEGAFIWRLEPQKRGAPHFHLLVYGVSLDADLAGWWRDAWYTVVGSGDERHLVHGVELEAIRSARGVRSYVSKYIAKKQVALAAEVDDEIDWSLVGRWWGVRYGKNLPFSQVMQVASLSYIESVRVLRAARGYLRSVGRRPGGNMPTVWLFVNSPSRWLDCLDGLAGGRYSGSNLLHLKC